MRPIDLYLRHHVTTCGTCRPDFICRQALDAVTELRRRTDRGGQVDGEQVEPARQTCRTAGHCLAYSAEPGCGLYALTWCWPICRQRHRARHEQRQDPAGALLALGVN